MGSSKLCRILVAALILAMPAGAQQDDAVPTQPATQPDVYAPVARSLQQLRPGRTVLLREGSVLVQTVGRVTQSQVDRWMLTIDRPDDEAGEPLELILLPCRVLEEMQRIVRATDGEQSTFEVTGEVFVYNDRNYFLPTHASQVVAPPEEDSGDEAPPGDDEPDASNDAPPSEAAPATDDSAEAIMQRLRKKAGSVARSSVPADTSAALDTQRTADASTLREGMLLVDRRGHLTRTSDGTWTFIFAADAEGLSDPPVRVLPCLLLERMQKYARRHSNVAPILLSGRVFEYRDRHYVLPTLYRVPQSRTPIVP